MALATYTTTYGVVYPLLNVKDSDNRTTQISQSGQQIAQAHGTWLPWGAGPALIDYGQIQATFLIATGWLIQNGYTGNLAGMETAIDDFLMNVVGGGLGTLKDNTPSGMKATKGSPTNITYRLCTAIVTSTTDVRRNPSSEPACEIDSTLMCPTGYWTRSDGSFRPLG